jgi:hypothetical protein
MTPPSPATPSTDTLILCATNWLAQYLKAQGVARLSGGRDAVCLTPQALTLAQWLDALHQEATLRGLPVVGLPPGVVPLKAAPVFCRKHFAKCSSF